MKLKALSLLLLLTASHAVFAGGGGPPSRAELWKTFYNPLADYPLEESVSDNTIRRLVQLLRDDLGVEKKYIYRTGDGQWYSEASLYEVLNPMVESSGRDLVVYSSGGSASQAPDNTVIFAGGGLPLERPGWSDCTSAGALRGTLELAEAWLEDESLSDFAVRNALYYRLNIAAECQKRPTRKLSERELQSIPAPWRDYLAALAHFYQHEYRQAGEAFAKLVDSEQATVADLSSYLAGRAFLIAAQGDWHGYGDPGEAVDRTLLARSAQYFRQHVERDGHYADSARGLLRRTAYLAGDRKAYYAGLKQNLDRLLAGDSTALQFLQVIDEGSRFGQGPALLEYLDGHYRQFAGDSELESLVRLLDFRRGVQHFRAGEQEEAYRLLMEAGLEPAYPYLVQIARESGDRQRLAAVYREFLDGNTLAMHRAALDYAERGAEAFVDTDNAQLAKRSALAYCSAGNLQELVLGNLSNKNLPELRDALYDAYIQREQFEALNRLMSSGDIDNGPYEAIRTAVRQLARGESLGKAYMNIGYFVAERMTQPKYSGANKFLASLDGDRYCESGLKSYDRGAQYFYRLSLAQFTPQERSTDEAKALHFMINCDRMGIRGCWGTRPEEAESSEVLFKRLHRKYPTSQWTEKTPYFY